MSELIDEPFYNVPNCHPLCDHMRVCVKCGGAKCIKRMKHSRMYGYGCMCGSHEWQALGTLRARDYPAAPDAGREP